MTGALFSLMSMAISGRELSAELGTFEILFIRSVIGLIIICLLLTIYGWDQVKTRQFGWHMIRNVTHFGGQYGWFYGIAIIPLAEVFAIEFTVPLWTGILAVLLLGEQMTRPRALAIVLGIAGVLIILRPGFAVINMASFIVLLSALGYAVSHTLTRKLAFTDTPLAILFYMIIIQLPLGLLPALNQWVTPSAAMWPWLVLVGLSGLSTHFCISKAMQHADATVVVPMDFLRLPLIAVVGYLFYQEPISAYVLLGGIVMFTGNSINLYSEQRKRVRS